MKRLAFVAVLLAGSVLVRAQQGARQAAPSARPVLVTGRVVADDDGNPVRNARIAILANGVGTRVVLTDPDGRFQLQAPNEPFTLTAAKTGYAPVRTAITPPPSSVEIRLERGGAITGRVFNDFGDPVVGASIAAETMSAASGTFTDAATALTDDRGEYRLGGLAAGAYVIGVTTIDSRLVRVAIPNGFASFNPRVKIYYPDAASPNDAYPIELTPAEEKSGVDFLIPATLAGLEPFGVIHVTPAPRTDVPTTVGTAQITGRVVDAAARALADAQVELVRLARPFELNRTRSGQDGTFVFRDLPEGTFRIRALKTGYAPVDPTSPEIPQDATSSRSITLSAGASAGPFDLTLSRWLAIEGRVLDENGDPVQQASIQLLQARYEGGRRRLGAVGFGRITTDDRGRYRVYGLTPGGYIVSAVVGEVFSADLPGYARTYFPGTSDPSQAQYVTVAPGGDLLGIDIVLMHTPTATVAGRILDSSGAPTTGGTIQLRPSVRSTSVTSVPVGARLLPDGSFEFPNVPLGQYVITVDRGRLNGSTEGDFGALPVALVNGDVTDLIVQTTAGSTIDGRITFNAHAASQPPPVSRLQITPVPVDPDLSPASGWATANVLPDGRFELAGIHGTRRLEVTRLPPGWALEEIRIGGIDATDRTLTFGTPAQSLRDVEVVLTDRITHLTATIHDGDARPAPLSRLIVFPTDRSLWYPRSRYLRIVVADEQGIVSVEGLPFGAYYAAPVSRVPGDGEDAWQDPAFLESLIRQASTVTLSEGRQLSIAHSGDGR